MQEDLKSLKGLKNRKKYFFKRYYLYIPKLLKDFENLLTRGMKMC